MSCKKQQFNLGAVLKKIAIFGGGGHGKVCASIAEDLGYGVSFFDDSYPIVSSCGNWLVEGNKEQLNDSVADFNLAL